MTSAETKELCEMITVQIGIPFDLFAPVLPLWQSNLVNIDQAKAMEGLKVLLLNGGPVGKDAGKWLAAIVRYCGGVQQSGNGEKKAEPDGCYRCLHSGTIEVPSMKDYREGVWRGIYTQVVACSFCPMGAMRACQMMNIRQYEGIHPDWQTEFPRRKYERQLRDMLSRPASKDKDDHKKDQSLIAWLKAELAKQTEVA